MNVNNQVQKKDIPKKDVVNAEIRSLEARNGLLLTEMTKNNARITELEEFRDGKTLS